MTNIARTTKKSTWTPLTNQEANHKIFAERRGLTSKWFEKWSDAQRREVLSDLVALCKNKQIDFIGDVINEKKPVYKDDFSRMLPRVLSLYILSYLDPRSLCSSAQVCWYWKHITELDHLWMPKCLSLGWVLPFSPSPYENGIWKKLYIENILALKCLVPKGHKKAMLLNELEDLELKDAAASTQRGKGKSPDKRPPWRGSDPNPKDMWRNNYLENDNEVDKVNKLRQKHLYGPLAEEVVRKAKNKVRTGEHAAYIKALHSERSRSAQSYYPGDRPNWAQTGSPGAPFVTKSGNEEVFDASVRPAASTTTAQLAKVMKERSAMHPPPKSIYSSQTSPWEVPKKSGSLDD